MADVVIDGVPDHVLAAIDAHAHKAGLSRDEYLRGLLQSQVGSAKDVVTVADLVNFSQTFADLADPGVMDWAWR
jgi:hypothetical protein